jgi:hypothetical protein
VAQRLRGSAAQRLPGGAAQGLPSPEAALSLLKRLLGKNDPPKERVRICVECGMPIAQHKDWCSIFQIENKLRAKQASQTSTS